MAKWLSASSPCKRARKPSRPKQNHDSKITTQKWRPEENNSGASMAPKSPKTGGHADDAKRGLSRRQVLGEGSALLGGALASGVATGQASAQTATTNTDNLPPNVPEWMKAPGDPMRSQLYG